MKIFIFLILVVSISVMGDTTRSKRKPSQSVDPLFLKAGDLTFGLTQDYDSGMDLITVTNSKEEKSLLVFIQRRRK